MIYLILLAALILRLISINQSLWLDEATSALVSKMNLTDIFTKFLPGDFHPPLYYLLLKYWISLFGYSEISLRVPSVIFGLITVYLTYLITKKLINRKPALFASALSASSGLAVYYSQEARMYAMAAMLVSLSVYLFIHKKWLYFSLCLVLIGMTDYVSLFIIPIFIIAGWREIKKIVVCFIPFVLVFLFWIPVFFKQLEGGLSFHESAWWNVLGQPTIKNIALVPIKFIFGRISFDDKLIYSLLAGIVIFIFGYLMIKARKSNLLLWLWLLVPIILGILISFKIPTLAYFRFLFCLPALYVLVAAGLDRVGKYQNALLVLVLSINLVSTGYYLFNPRFHREDWRAAAKALGSEKIVFPAGSQEEALIYYGKGSQIVHVSSLGAGDKEVWLSRYVWDIVDQSDSTRHTLESLGYNKLGEYNFNGVILWKYSKNLYARRD